MELQGLLLWVREALPRTVYLNRQVQKECYTATEAVVTIHAVIQIFDLVVVGTRISLTK